ncbi:MAG: hypothetical protein U0744_09525 [Gemmataceae bacterium]
MNVRSYARAAAAVAALVMVVTPVLAQNAPPLVRSSSPARGPAKTHGTWAVFRKRGPRRHSHWSCGELRHRFKEVIRLVQIAGTLDFARDRNTRLEAGLINVIADEEPSEEGFDCHAAPKKAAHGAARPTLYVGKPGNPIPGNISH